MQRCVLALFASGALLISGCYVESMDDRPPGAPGVELVKGGRDGNHDAGTCRFGFGKGCFDGHIVAKKEFFVDGTSYFDADNYGAQFGRQLEITDADGKPLVAGKDFVLALDRPIGNQNFSDDFEYDLTGDVSRSGKVRASGDFSINDLPPGMFALRILKPVRFSVTRKVAHPAPPTRPEGPIEPAPTIETVVEQYCATLFADSEVDVRRGERVWNTFNDFRLHVTTEECAAGDHQSSIALRPIGGG